MNRCPHVRAAGIVRDGRVLCSACEWQRMERAERRWRLAGSLGWLVVFAFAGVGIGDVAQAACRVLLGWPR